MDRGRAELAQITGLAQLFAKVDNQFLGARSGRLRVASSAAMSGPIDTIQPRLAGMRDPALDRVQTRTKVPGHGPHRLSFTHCGNHVSTMLLDPVFESQFNSQCEGFSNTS